MGKYGKTYHYDGGLSLAVETAGGPWVIRWTDTGTGKSKRRSTGTDDLDTARAVIAGFSARQMHEAVVSGPGGANGSVRTVGEVLDGYERYLKEHGKHRSNLDLIMKLRRFWGDRPVTSVCGASQREYEDGRRHGLYTENRVIRTRLRAPRGGAASDSTLAREIGCLNAAINWSARSGLIPQAQKVSLIALPGSVRRPPALSAVEAEELMRLAAETSAGRKRLTRIHRFVWLACVTGARCEAIETLKWDQVDFDVGATGIIDFRDASKRATKKKRPVQPISPRLVDLLRQAYRERIGEFVLDEGRIADAWLDFRARSPWADVDLRRHDLRAAAITSALGKGMPVAKAAVFFGVTIAVVEKHYLRPGPDFLADVHSYI